MYSIAQLHQFYIQPELVKRLKFIVFDSLVSLPLMLMLCLFVEESQESWGSVLT